MTGAPADPRQAYLQHLAEAHGFSLEELAMNRRGQLHPAQVARGRRAGIGCAVLAIVLAVLSVAGGIAGALEIFGGDPASLSGSDRSGLYALIGGGVLLAAVFLAGATVTFWKVGRRRSAYARGRALFTDGPIHKVHIQRRGGGPSEWRYVVVGVHFPVSRKAWELIAHGARYRVYHLAGDLLSLEPF